jgi:PAS domain S-box-containing protein
MHLPPHSATRDGSAENEARLKLLVDTGLLLASERSLDVIVQAALDAGLRLSGAMFGAFFYNNIGEEGETYQLYKISGLDPMAFSGFPMPRPTAIFAETFLGRGILRSGDITKDRRYGLSDPFRGMPGGHPPIRSYLAVPVRSRGGEVLGGLLYGHPSTDVFQLESENLVATVAAQAAVAIDNVRLAENLNREVALTDAARSLQRETSERLRQALEGAQMGTWAWDRATDLLDLDERSAELFGTQPHVPVTRTALRERIVNEEDMMPTVLQLQQALATGGLYAAEYRIELPDGRQTWVSARGVTTFRAGTQEITGMIGTAQDITQRKLSEASLRQSEKLAATGRLAATIAHEINNPLEAVTNLIYLCKTDPNVPGPVRHLLETADHELGRVAHIAQQTLGFYRDTTRPTDIDLNVLLEGVVDLFSRSMQSQNILCELQLEPGLHIYGLQGEIRQVFSNLLVNAIDASPSGSCIRIRAHRARTAASEGVTVLMADEGSGVPLSIRKRLFSPFFTTKESVGTGLGLWVTRGIVEKQGGSITFRSSTKPPSGTVFRVFLKAHMESAAAYQKAPDLLQ